MLIGDNGSGTSTLIEALELLRKASQPRLLSEFSSVHGGTSALLRSGCTELTLCAEAVGDAGALRYSVTLALEGEWPVIAAESLDVGPFPPDSEPLHAILRNRERASAFDQAQGRLVETNVQSDQTMLAGLSSWPNQRAIQRMHTLLAGIDVQLPVDTRPLWVYRERKWTSPLRESSTILRATRLNRLGENLANCFHTMKNELGIDHWRETMDLVRLGLGNDVRDVNVVSGASSGNVSLAVEFSGRSTPITAVPSRMVSSPISLSSPSAAWTPTEA